ncbi:oxygen-independent coproporphyrinogen III oxidase [Nitratireductor sp. ZSWI3]|uniref:oxygen-independent coproporphyrinogen III oxidase n=1 Tax=Nitratireductor sp. ZSWI3 TaxID=2966359 RepID=UPI00214F8CB9|nr:oxygen-independent coproporphyrinogen III oxidase [Nitratireductor sp. ZSWI3]MCR4269063.1 oxygen-independent coproporphyrinogen III oxidase [Nitratireductor sp. ZSWI3]
MQRAGEQMSGTGSAGRLSEAVPRYTSYPTAPHFHAGITGEIFENWLAALPEGEEISLYVHVPFCDRLCWFCACHTKMTHRYEPVSVFLDALLCEIATVGALVGGWTRVKALHFGGGSPTILKPQDVIRLGAALRSAFEFVADAEISVELDPNDMDDARFDAFAAIGMTRASLGVQDFDPRVQQAINREQTFEQTRAVVDGVRARGVRSVNLDLLYGLPHQTVETVGETIRQALTLAPDRIALFGYAHVPWFKKHQTMIDEAVLPGPGQRFAQQQEAARIVREAGYQPIGIDHFARPDDPLALAARAGRLYRNFQGYTEDACKTLIGLGPSSVSRLSQGYAQNNPAIGQYERLVGAGGLATVRGIAFSDEDRARAWVIERLMCDFTFSAEEAVRLFGDRGRQIVEEARDCVFHDETAGLIETAGAFVVREEARPLVRSTAARFDQYLKRGGARHSAAV